MKLRLSFFRQSAILGLALTLAGTGVAIGAQQPPAQAPAQAPAQTFTPAQLDDLVAPIALYPDPLLGQVLAASTYPLEIVEAQQWLNTNSGLAGAGRMDAARQQNWDPSVQALVAFPDVLARLNSDVRWTTDLGNAFLAQQVDVMQAVQRMRSRAQANGKLSSSQQETVTTQTDNGQSAIEIAPANPQVIYVPYYDPAYVWGPPAWGYYPALAYPGFGFGFWPGIDVGFYFGGWGLGPWAGWGGWGWGPNWFGGGLFINAGFFNHYGFRGGFGAGRGMIAWAHDPAHRLGVAYSNARLTQRYGAASRSNAASMGSRYTGSRYASGGQSFRANRGAAGAAMERSQAGRQFGNNAAPRAYQGNRASTGQSNAHSFAARPSAQSAPRYSAPAQHYSAPAQHYSAPAQHYSAPAQHYSAPAQHYSAPAQHYSAPAQHYSAPHSNGGGGAARSSGGGRRR